LLIKTCGYCLLNNINDFLRAWNYWALQKMINTAWSQLFGCKAWWNGWVNKWSPTNNHPQEGRLGLERREMFTTWGGIDSPSWWRYLCLGFGSQSSGIWLDCLILTWYILWLLCNLGSIFLPPISLERILQVLFGEDRKSRLSDYFSVLARSSLHRFWSCLACYMMSFP
jgi:hypothetical protein